MRKALFPGSFDPLTSGHLDILKRCLPLFDEIVIGVLNNPDKNPMFTADERCSIIEETLTSIDSGNCTVTVTKFSGLTAEFARSLSANAIIRGIRAISDYEYELKMTLMNRRLAPEIETVFVMAAEEYSFVSSSLLKQVFSLGGRIDDLVPRNVIDAMRRKSQ